MNQDTPLLNLIGYNNIINFFLWLLLLKIHNIYLRIIYFTYITFFLKTIKKKKRWNVVFYIDEKDT